MLRLLIPTYCKLDYFVVLYIATMECQQEEYFRMNFRLNESKAEEVSVIRLIGEVNKDAVQIIKKQADELLASGTNKMVFDVSNASYVDSDGLGLLIDIHERCVDAGGNMTAVCTNNPKVYRNFKLLRLIERFGVHESIENALVILKTER